MNGGIDKKMITYGNNLRNYAQEWIRKMPAHVSLILDGNRRFASKYNLPLESGHLFGLFSTISTAQNFMIYGIREVTVWGWALSNFKRSEHEKNVIFDLFVMLPFILERLYKPWIEKFRIKLSIVGNLNYFPIDVQLALKSVEDLSASNPIRFLNLCVGYGWKDELWTAYLKANERHESIKSVEEIMGELQIKHKVDLFIRPGKEIRDSGFLPLQSADAEKYYLMKFLPEITKDDVEQILSDYLRRDIRKGGGKGKKMPEAKNVITKDLKQFSPHFWNKFRAIF